MFHPLRMLSLAGALSALMTPASAQTVTLRTENNSIQLSGKLVEFDGTTYALETSIGMIQLAAKGLICEGDACPATGPDLDFVASGVADASAKLLPALMAGYAAASGETLEISPDKSRFTTSLGDDTATIDVTTKPSSAALDDLISGRSSVAFTTRAPSADEQDRLAQAGASALRESVLAIGGLVIVMARENALPSISVRDAARIFSGEVSNWSELGGPDAAIAVYTREDSAAVTEVFETLVLEPTGREMSPQVVQVSSETALASSVAADPYGIGFTDFSQGNAAVQLPIIGQCGLIVTPSDFNIRAEEYPLSYRLRAIAKDGAQSELLEAMMAFAPSDAAQAEVARAGMINQTLARSPVDQQGMRFASALQSDKVVAAIPRLQAMVSEMVVSERLSATFRFEAGSQTLDERGREDILRIARMLEDETATGATKTVRIMGFTDSLGNADLNQELSVRRANLVLESIIAVNPALANNVTFSPMGFGDVSPIGCDQSATGRWINRRVEVWISAN